MTIPYWVQDTIFYQIFPDRFANGDPANDPVNVRRWEELPTGWGFHGGDLRGIINHFDYLLELGINGIYLNPIFESTSTHRYNTTDYFRIDKKLGTLKDFLALLDVAHRNQVKVILDGVFNHCGRGFFAFNDVLENQDHSPYKDWFYIQHFPVDAYSPGDAKDYLSWWKFKSLPKLNTKNPKVTQYIFDIARYWIELGADGWRLDVPNEIDDDAFWDEFRANVKMVNPDAYLVGEIWDGDSRWVGDTHFDGLMNYPLREAILWLMVKKIKPSAFMKEIERLNQLYPTENLFAMYQLLGSHDTERVMTLCEKDPLKVMGASFLTFSLMGAPAIYYGDEIGLEGGRDPDCRRTFPWEKSQWNSSLRDWYKKLINLRKQSIALRRGYYYPIFDDDEKSCFAFLRRLGDDSVLVIYNVSDEKISVSIDIKQLEWGIEQSAISLINNESFSIHDAQLNVTLNPWSGEWISQKVI
jgi:cyclomaltodextrinase